MSVQIIIHGLVQGVGYRRFVELQARTLGIAGWVRNLTTGEVEVWAVGAKDRLESLFHELRRGPPGSLVEKLEIHERTMPEGFTINRVFTVRVDGEKPI
ncbi:MAG: acylphosphatase [Bdellovibrio sp.]|nr:MAG: acylphosphatase [Bdellovibrio sp.]